MLHALTVPERALSLLGVICYTVEPATLRGVISRDRRDGANGRYTGQTLHFFCSTGTKYVLSVVVVAWCEAHGHAVCRVTHEI